MRLTVPMVYVAESAKQVRAGFAALNECREKEGGRERGREGGRERERGKEGEGSYCFLGSFVGSRLPYFDI